MKPEDLTHKQIIFECIAGSHAYGTQHAESDVDLRGIFVLPARTHLGLAPASKQVSDRTNDITFYELRRYLELAADCNPNIIELLWTPADCVKRCTPAMKLLVDHRQTFISQQAYHTFSGYAYAQIKRARGQNKWVNKPQPEAAPERSEFCWIIPDQPHTEALPMRPLPLPESGIELRHCHAAKLEHAADCFRLYAYPPGEARGVFRGQSELVCESIPLGDERSHFVGLLLFNRQAFERAKTNWSNYWDWRKNRNEARYRSQEAGEIDYDAKNVMHCLRLLWSGASILETGEPIVRFSGERLKTLKEVRHGRFSYEEVMALVETEKARLETLRANSKLPKTASSTAIEALYFDCLALWQSSP
jgi:predicted nucleotidyltransferase